MSVYRTIGPLVIQFNGSFKIISAHMRQVKWENTQEKTPSTPWLVSGPEPTINSCEMMECLHWLIKLERLTARQSHNDTYFVFKLY